MNAVASSFTNDTRQESIPLRSTFSLASSKAANEESTPENSQHGQYKSIIGKYIAFINAIDTMTCKNSTWSTPIKHLKKTFGNEIILNKYGNIF